MEKKLRYLFDYQKFQRNPRLDAMLAESEGRCAEVDEGALEQVSAAGDGPLTVHRTVEGADHVGALVVEDLL